MRADGRSTSQLRPIRITPNFTNASYGSVMIETGDTKVLCTAHIEESIPGWMRSSRQRGGWLTAEYSMLPGSTTTRTKRERGHLGGRTQEIQRIIGRSLRGIIDLSKLPDFTIVIDCDVLQADGGTRTAAVTGGYIALKLAINNLMREGRLRVNPIREAVAAVSVGVKEGVTMVDLDYKEDNNVDLDMNIVMTRSGKLLEIQGTAERAAFTKEQVLEIMTTAEEALMPVFDLQVAAEEGRVVEL
jgi:ribonuclease PH